MYGIETVRADSDTSVLDAALAIYGTSFPPQERIEKDELLNGYPDKDTDFSAVTLNGEVVAMYYTVSDGTMVFLYYIAVKERCRSRGIGSKVLDLIEGRHGLPIVLNIEETSEKAADHDVRNRRREFYLRNGFRDTGKILVDSQGVFNVLCTGAFDEDRYLEFLNSFGEEDCSYR